MSTPSPAPFNVFLDSDGPIADFDLDLAVSGMHPDDFKLMPGIYLWLSVTPSAKHSIEILKRLDDQNLLRVWVLTKTPSNSPYSYSEKILWYRKHFPWLEDRVIITHDKSLMGTEADFLLDDRPLKANAKLFRGTFVYFNPTEPNTSWHDFINQVTARIPGTIAA